MKNDPFIARSYLEHELPMLCIQCRIRVNMSIFSQHLNLDLWSEIGGLCGLCMPYNYETRSDGAGGLVHLRRV